MSSAVEQRGAGLGRRLSLIVAAAKEELRKESSTGGDAGGVGSSSRTTSPQPGARRLSRAGQQAAAAAAAAAAAGAGVRGGRDSPGAGGDSPSHRSTGRTSPPPSPSRHSSAGRSSPVSVDGGSGNAAGSPRGSSATRRLPRTGSSERMVPTMPQAMSAAVQALLSQAKKRQGGRSTPLSTPPPSSAAESGADDRRGSAVDEAHDGGDHTDAGSSTGPPRMPSGFVIESTSTLQRVSAGRPGSGLQSTSAPSLPHASASTLPSTVGRRASRQSLASLDAGSVVGDGGGSVTDSVAVPRDESVVSFAGTGGGRAPSRESKRSGVSPATGAGAGGEGG